ncbi:MAG: hypothetical protein ACXWCZ_12945, partial [Flavisolibacter sp.]
TIMNFLKVYKPKFFCDFPQLIKSNYFFSFCAFAPLRLCVKPVSEANQYNLSVKKYERSEYP